MCILGIYLDEGEPSVIKNLKLGWYPILNVKNGAVGVPKVDTCITLSVPSDFYLTKEIESINKERSSFPKITISCIVGRNGSGKSTLLELFYRIINNLSWHLQKELGYEGCEIEYAEGFSACLYFEENNKVGCIKIDAYKKEAYVKNPGEKEISLHDKGICNLKILERLFYSIVTNYSMYSFNPEDYNFKGADNYYPNGIFHKNDGYITPIVILPFRDKDGVIDIANERDLARQRIIALQIYLYNHNDNGYLLVEQRVPEKIEYRFDKKYIERKNKKGGNVCNELFQELLIKISKMHPDKPFSFSSDIGNLDIIQQAWIEKLKTFGIDVMQNISDENLRKTLLFYLAYKTLKISVQYELFLDKWLFSGTSVTKESCLDIIERFLKDKSHITLKLRQCVEFSKCPYTKDSDMIPISSITTKKENETVDDYFLKLPPAFYESDLLFTPKKGSEEIKMSSLSSGELQFLNTISYVLYHLKNLDSEKPTTNTK